MTILSIDPGPVESGWCVFDGARVVECGTDPNAFVLGLIRGDTAPIAPRIAIEMVASYGMPVGREVFETVLWIGRFVEGAAICCLPVRLVYRRDVKLHLCQSARAKDPNVRQALIDLLGPVGTKSHPGPCYGVSGHIWSALAVAVYASQVPETGPATPHLPCEVTA